MTRDGLFCYFAGVIIYAKFSCLRLIKCGLNSTTILVYGMLISRATLSQKNGWIDEKGHVYIRYSNEQLAEDIGKSLSTIKNSLKELTEQGFIIRKRIDINAKLIYNGVVTHKKYSLQIV